MTLRACIFWLKDFFVGNGCIKRAYKEVESGFLTGKENLKQREILVQWAKKEVRTAVRVI